MAYAIELLAGVRPGEASALRWRHYDPTMRPLGKLLVAKSYSTRVGDLPLLGLAASRHYDMRATFITLIARSATTTRRRVT